MQRIRAPKPQPTTRPDHADGSVRPLMNIWKIVKNKLPFLGTRLRLRISSGAILISATPGNAGNALSAVPVASR